MAWNFSGEQYGTRFAGLQRISGHNLPNVHEDGRIEPGFVPVHVEAPGRPVLATGLQATIVLDYVRSITTDAGLPPLAIETGVEMVTVSA